MNCKMDWKISTHTRCAVFLAAAIAFLIAGYAYAANTPDCIKCSQCEIFARWSSVCSSVSEICYAAGSPKSGCDEKRNSCEKIADVLIAKCLAISCDANGSCGSQKDSSSVMYAGWRSSDYGYQQQEEPSYWIYVAKEMASKFPGAKSSGIWILGTDNGDGTCGLSFPDPGKGPYQNIEFDNVDRNEKYLKAFDDAGLAIWLQIEPADANVDQLIDLVLDKYSHHSSVIGFGIDVEWLESNNNNPGGRPVTSVEAKRWLDKVKSYNPNYQFFLKHWDVSYMPETHYKDTVFISDSLDHQSLGALVDNFANEWTSSFADDEVGFQIGYDIDNDGDGRSDRDWWKLMNDPPKEIGDAIIARIPNVKGIYWVDFTVKEVFPGA